MGTQRRHVPQRCVAGSRLNGLPLVDAHNVALIMSPAYIVILYNAACSCAASCLYRLLRELFTQVAKSLGSGFVAAKALT